MFRYGNHPLLDEKSSGGGNNLDLNNLTPEQQKILDIGFAKGAEKKEGELKDLQGKHADAVRKLSSMEESSKLTKEERDKYLQQVREYEERNLTEGQKFEKRLADERAQLEKLTQAAKQEAGAWRSRHDELIIQSALANTATKLDALVPQQVVSLMRPAIELQVEDADSDNPRYIPKVKSKDKKTGAAVLVDLEEGVKAFLDENPNLMRSNVVGRRDGKLETITGADGKTVFTEEQLNDPAFINDPKNWEVVKKAMASGNVRIR